MVRGLNIISMLAIISAVAVFVLCAVQQLQGAQETEENPDLTIIEKFNMTGASGEKSQQKIVNPLVEQAQAFALYLNPPKPKPQKTRQAHVVPEQRTVQVLNEKITTAESTKLKPKFTLVGTSYYRSNPQKSMALVSEPDKGVHWVKQGAHLGHFIVDEVKRGMIVYRDGKLLCEMAVDTKVPVRTEQVKQTKLASDQKSPSPPRHQRPPKTKPNTKPRKPMHRLGPSRPEIRPVAYDHTSASG